MVNAYMYIREYLCDSFRTTWNSFFERNGLLIFFIHARSLWKLLFMHGVSRKLPGHPVHEEEFQEAPCVDEEN